MSVAGEILWSPPPDARRATAMGKFLLDVEREHDVRLPDYDAFWHWSVANLDAFWQSFARHFDIAFHDECTCVLTSSVMPDAEWFTGATLNYAEHALRGAGADVVLESHSQTRGPVVLTRAELRAEVARVRSALVDLGVQRGDRVAAYMPSIAETAVLFLASASLGSIFVSCAPEFGTQSVIDRLSQVEPKVLFVVDGYRFGTREVDRVDDVAVIRAALPALAATVVVPYLDANSAARVADAHPWSSIGTSGELVIDPVPFDHPLYILFSSGSTGAPKPIVHGHGGITLEHIKCLLVHSNIDATDRVLWPSSTSWMSWNLGLSALLCGAAVILIDGDVLYPDLASFWRFVSDARVTFLGTSPPFLMACRRQGLVPKREADLSRLRGITSGGSPLPAEGFRWVYDAVSEAVMLVSMSGGTDVCSAFVGGAPLLPVRAGEIACRMLGVMVEAYNEAGEPVLNEQAELVVTKPMPSMPVGIWGDPGGDKYREMYFEHYPGVWRHGDWISISDRGSAIITGRSDATLNRGGVRMGTQDFYSALAEVPEIEDGLVVHLEDHEGGLGELLLFVALIADAELTGELRKRIEMALRDLVSPRHVPNEIYPVPVIPRTITGKRLEIPVKRIMSGQAVTQAATGSLEVPGSLQPFVELAAERRSTNDRRADRVGQ